MTQEVASIIEQELIKKYSTDNSNFGYNIRSGGFSGYKIEDSTKEKLRERFSGEGGYWYGMHGENHPRYKKNMPPESVEIIKQKNKKINWSEETRQKKENAYKRLSIKQKGIVPYKAIEKRQNITREENCLKIIRKRLVKH